ncbi:MAG: hypothetical protein KAI83_16005 [Thiomargarita sp.]|nr:hypothetical protein [Thiomargarita sp.]
MLDNNRSSNLKPTNILSQLQGIIFGSLFLCWWQPVFAEMLTVIEDAGANQVIHAGQISEDIRFQLLDDFGNPLITEAGNAVTFTLTAPSSSTAELTTESAVTDQNGEITTNLTTTDTLGSYTITAQLESDASVSATAHLFVTDPPPDLPSLCFGGAIEDCIGGAIDAEGAPLYTDAKFYGGFSIDGRNDFKQNVQINKNSSVFVEGIIQVDSQHIGKNADIIVVAMVITFNPSSEPEMEMSLHMLDNLTISRDWDWDWEDGTPASWEKALKTLKSFKNDIDLPEILPITFSIPLWAGNFVGLDTTDGRYYTAYGYFGYRLLNDDDDDDVIVFKKEPIEITVAASQGEPIGGGE